MPETLSELVDGRSVALVGNSQRILKERPGHLIDSADVVVRINRGLPSVVDASAVGKRTTIWATAKYWSDLVCPADCKAIVWMKLTKLGEIQKPFAMHAYKGTPFFVWTQMDEDECREFVGADPGTGIRLLWWLRTHSEARAVSCYGMDCWEVPSHWSGLKNTPNHNPELERAAMLRLL